MSFALADVQNGMGPYVTVFLKSVAHWGPAQIGVALAAGNVAQVLAQAPTGGLIDQLRQKRELIVVGSLMILAAFMAVLRGHVAALRAQPDLLTPDAAAALDVVQAGLQGGVPQRLAALQLGGLSRQTWQETLMFRLWFLVDHPPAASPGQPQASSAARM